jgi:hypothetical protein
MGAMAGKASRVCAVPGCGATLYRGNRTGVCRNHNHELPYCQCVQCLGGKTRRHRGADYRGERQADEILLLMVRMRARGFTCGQIADAGGGVTERQVCQRTDDVKRADIAFEEKARGAYWGDR